MLVSGDRRREESQRTGPSRCKTDRIDAWVLAELSRRDLVPAIWLPDPAVRSDLDIATALLTAV